MTDGHDPGREGPAVTGLLGGSDANTDGIADEGGDHEQINEQIMPTPKEHGSEQPALNRESSGICSIVVRADHY